MKKSIITLLILALLGGLSPKNSHAQAPAPDDIVCALDVIVQVDDWLSKLSDKFYGDVLVFSVIADATNAKATVDDSYAVIEDVDLIEPGWQLCIVGVDVAEEMLGYELENAPIADTTPVNLSGPIKVGAAHALSGPLAAQGQSIQAGINLAVKEINNTGFLGDGELQIIWQDTAGETPKAINAFNNLIDQEQVVAILGPTLSRSAFKTDRIAQKSGVPVIGSSNVAEGLTDIGDYVFRTSLPESIVIQNTVQRAKEILGLQRVVIVYDDSNTFTRAGQNYFEQALSDEGLEILAAVPFSAADEGPDFSNRFAKLKTLNPDAIILIALSQDAATIILQAGEFGVSDKIRFIGANSLNTPLFLETGQQAVEGTLTGTFWNITNASGRNRQFVADYEAEYENPPNHLAAQAYTAMWSLAAALRHADSIDRADVRDALAAIEFLESPLGLFSFTEDRNPDYPPVIQVVENGEFALFQ